MGWDGMGWDGMGSDRMGSDRIAGLGLDRLEEKFPLGWLRSDQIDSFDCIRAPARGLCLTFRNRSREEGPKEFASRFKSSARRAQTSRWRRRRRRQLQNASSELLRSMAGPIYHKARVRTFRPTFVEGDPLDCGAGPVRLGQMRAGDPLGPLSGRFV